MENWFGEPEGPRALFARRILGFGEEVALVWGRSIAAIAEANGCVAATGNVRHFRGVAEFVNPLKEIMR